MIRLVTPTIARLEGYSKDPKLKLMLAYVDKKVEYDIKRLKDQLKWYLNDSSKYENLQLQIEELKKQRNKSLLFEDRDGLWTYSGLANVIAQAFGDQVVRSYDLVPPKLLPWNNPPKYAPDDYQKQAAEALVAGSDTGPKRIEVATGLGKSLIIALVIKSLGLKSIVVSPSTSIAKQLYDEFCYLFGKRYVGFFGGGKKQSDKLITVAIDDSLVQVTEESEHWANLRSNQVLTWDESHTSPALTLQEVCMGLLGNVPRRYFASATQERADGTKIVLDGITGDTVLSMTAQEGVERGYLAKPVVSMVQVTSNARFIPTDPGKCTRQHLYYNPKVNEIAALLANRFVSANRPTLILIQEIEQFSYLLPHLKHQVAFAHAALTDKNKKTIPKEYWESDITGLVSDFNDGKIPILVGTTCISMGTDLRVPEAVIYLQGQSSVVKVMQALGRSTRGGFSRNVLNPWTKQKKLDCFYVDFDVVNVPLLHRHANIRKNTYKDAISTVQTLDFTKNERS